MTEQVERRVHDLQVLVEDLKSDAFSYEGNQVLRQNFGRIVIAKRHIEDLIYQLSPMRGAAE